VGLVTRTATTLAPGSPATRTLECCNTTVRLRVAGWRREAALDRAEATARRLESQLDAFDETSAVARLNRDGAVTNEHVAQLVERALAYRDRTDGAFDVGHGDAAHRLKDYLRGDRHRPPNGVDPGPDWTAGVRVSDASVETDRPLDLNGLAKGYVVDRTYEALVGPGRRGFVDGGGDIASPTGPVGVESPYGDTDPLHVLDTDWHVATSAGYNQRRGGVDHVYDPQTGALGSRHDLVTVVAARDCTEADALATALNALPVDDALTLAESWDGVEALAAHAGVFHRTAGFEDHVHAQ